MPNYFSPLALLSATGRRVDFARKYALIYSCQRAIDGGAGAAFSRIIEAAIGFCARFPLPDDTASCTPSLASPLAARCRGMTRFSYRAILLM